MAMIDCSLYFMLNVRCSPTKYTLGLQTSKP